MNPTSVKAERGWSWIVAGWHLFRQAPLPWVLMMAVYGLISIVLSGIPLLGPLAYALIVPALTGGMIFAAKVLEEGGTLEVVHLFQAFRQQERTVPMLALGGLLLGGTLLIALVLGVLFMGGLAMTMGGGMGPGYGPMGPDYQAGMEAAGWGLLGFLVSLALMLGLLMAVFYAVPLVMLEGHPPWPAVQASLGACLKNLLALLVFGVIVTLLSLVAAIPLGLGYLILGPVTFAAVYVSYREIFPQPEQKPGVDLTKG
ncbi:MAG: BPSS1780 family membrane protein [Candidatus Competibacteraceae bacterium]|nr:BPSS1780 family membrane protein [Candidatus Competibacteraceae bacterium]